MEKRRNSEIKIAKAKKNITYFLQTSSYSIEEIAKDLGYSLDHFLYDYLKDEWLILEAMGEDTLRLVSKKLKEIQILEEQKAQDALTDIYVKFLEMPTFDLIEIASSLGYELYYFKNQYLKNEKRQQHLSKEMRKQIKEKYEKCKEYEKEIRKQNKIKHCLEILNLYANTLYSLDEIKGIVKRNKGCSIPQVIEEYETLSGKKLDQDLLMKIKKRSSEAASIQRRMKNTKDYYVIEEERYLSLLKKDIIGISKYQLSLLNTISIFLENYGDMKKTVSALGKSYNSIYTDLTASDLKEILKPEVNAQVEEYIQIENILSGNGVSGREKRQFIEKIVKEFIQNNFVIETTMKNTLIPDSAICRILKDPYVGILIREKEVLQFIKKEVTSYEDAFIQQQENRK